MESIHNAFSYDCYDSSLELLPGDAALLQEARRATSKAYAPYSHFQVGAALRLSNEIIITGGNQENASFPAGFCAERVALASADSQYMGVPIEAMAVSYDNKQGKSTHPISPCGICRQSLVEYEQKLKHPIRMILSGLEGKVFIVESASSLLPLRFSADDMNR